jgi:L-alanine-DL-glutamate epimerase-like enolase superfamily enzyme
MGERLYTLYQFRDLLNHRGAAYIRPDLSFGWWNHQRKEDRRHR